MGALKSHLVDPVCWKHFKDKNVVILPDNDDNGRKHARQVARLVQPFAASIKIIEIPGLPEGGDVADWLGCGGTRARLEEAAPLWPEWADDDGEPRTWQTNGAHRNGKGPLRLTEGELIPETQRNAWLTRWGGVVRRKGADTEEIDAFLQTLNARRCDPPLAESEVASISRSVSKYDPADPLEVPEPHQPFPVETLPAAIQPFVGDVAKAIGCDVTYVALPALAALASAVGNSRSVRLKNTWTEPCVLWLVIVGPSGSKKSAPLGLAVRPLTDVQAQRLHKFEGQWDEHKEKLGRHKRAGRQEGPAPRPPTPVERLVIDDITVEKVIGVLDDSPRGVLLAKDELSGWFAGFKRYSSTSNLSAWLPMHSSLPVTYDRKTGDQPTLCIDRAALSIAGGIQPEVLARYLTPEFLGPGCIARLFFAMPDPRFAGWTEDEVDPEVLAGWSRLLEGLLALQMERKKPVALPLSPDAKVAFVQFCNEWKSELEGAADDALRASLAKLEGGAARLALLYHVVGCVARGEDAKSAVTLEAMEAGIRLARWFAGEARRVLALRTERGADGLVELIRRRGGKVKARELQKDHGTQYPTVAAAEAALDGLEGQGVGSWVDVPPGPKGGRPTREFRLAGGCVGADPDGKVSPPK
jgi:hypothetical protein